MKPETQPKPILVKKSVKHTFDTKEVAQLHVDFGQAYDAVKSAEADFDSVKAVHKATIQAAESKMILLRATINAGFEDREKELVVIFHPERKKKTYHVPTETGWLETPALTEDMQPQDFQQDLIQAESIFSHRKELTLWKAGNDLGVLIIGQLGNKWYSALRANVGAVKLEERLDSEQKAYKTREAAINFASTRALEWLEATMGKETAKGFCDGIKKLADDEAGKVE